MSPAGFTPARAQRELKDYPASLEVITYVIGMSLPPAVSDLYTGITAIN